MNPEVFIILPSHLVRLFSQTALSFVLAIALTPVISDLLYHYKAWKQPREEALAGGRATEYLKLHGGKHKKTPTMAGVLIWLTVLIMTLLFNLSRAQTWLPLFSLIAVALLGLVDDLINVTSPPGMRGIGWKTKTLWLILIGLVGGWWFYQKLGYGTEIPFHIPGVGDFMIGASIVPLFVLTVFVMANAVNITDGLDGLAGGLIAQAFAAYAIIAIVQGRVGLAVFCGTIVGATLAYTWFNIHPARFFMGDTGSLALGATLGIVAMLTNSLVVLPIIGFVFVVDFLSSAVQILSRKLFDRKIFKIAPLHHHFEAIGWEETKVTQRFWVIGAIMTAIGLAVALIGRGVG